MLGAVRRSAAACAVLGFVLLIPIGAASAREGVVVRDARTPIDYALELEPHLLAGSGPPGRGVGSGGGIGVRASFVIAPEGFIRGVNDSVAIGVGLDYTHYYGAIGFYGYRDQCLHFEPGPAGTSVCTETSSNGGTYNYAFAPVYIARWYA